jgi:hypothetical protein
MQLDLITSAIFYDMTPFSPLTVNRLFVGTCRVHLLGRRRAEQELGVKGGDKQSKPQEDWYGLQSYADSVCGRCTADYMKLCFNK